LKIFALISYPFLPATTGGEISTQNILEYMARVNQVKVFTVDPYHPVNEKEFSFQLDFGMRFTPWRYANVFLLPRLIRQIISFKADAIFLDQPWMGWMIPFFKWTTGKQVFLRSNNIEYMRFKSMGKPWWRMLYFYERFVYRQSNLVIFVSDIDQQKAIQQFGLNINQTLLTPYGIPQSELPVPISNARQIILERHSIPAHHKILLFFATLSYKPNYDAVAFIKDEIYPRLSQQLGDGFTILICGKNLPTPLVEAIQSIKNIQYLGFVADIETYIDGADVMINPILSGGGVKTKAIDTLGRGQTVVSTVTGAEGIDPAVCDSHLKIAKDYDWDAFIQLLQAHFGSTQNPLPQQFFATYSWPGIIQKLMQKLEH
jgi:polysaccharide biosynthesis protein PslH